MRYGYKVAMAYLTPPNSPGARIAFDDPELGADGARGLLQDALQALTGGAEDEQRYHHSRLDGVHMDGWGVLLTVSGGSYGEAAEVVDRRTGRARRALARDDAVLRDARLLWLMPPHGTVGLLLSEARGRSHLGPAVVRRLNNYLKPAGEGYFSQLKRSLDGTHHRSAVSTWAATLFSSTGCTPTAEWTTAVGCACY